MSEMSKKELKELRKLEEMRRSSMEKKANMTKWIAIGGISTIFLGFFLFLVISLRGNNPNLTDSNSNTVVELSNSGEFRVAAASTVPKEGRPVILTEFADIQCPACKQYHPIIKSVLDLYPDTVVLNFKHFPISSIHKNALPSALASEAAGKQGKFFEMLDVLYERQEAWSNLSNPKSLFTEYATELGLNLDQFNKDMEDNELAQKIEAQRTEGINAGVNSTPSFFINGVKIQNPSDISGFQAAIDAALSAVVGESKEPDIQDSTSTPSAEDTDNSSAPQINL